MEVYRNNGPPAYISLAIAHKTKAGKKGKGQASGNSESTEGKKTGTMADLAAMFGLSGKNKRAMI